MQDGCIRQPRTWWFDKATSIAATVITAVDCVCKDWKAVRTALFKTLCRFPDAQAAVLLKLEQMATEGLLPIAVE